MVGGNLIIGIQIYKILRPSPAQLRHPSGWPDHQQHRGQRRGLRGDEQRSQGRQHEGRSETAAAAGGYQGADDVPGVSGQTEEHDIPLRPRNLSDVRGQNERVSDMQENCGEENITLLA